jgi:transposase
MGKPYSMDLRERVVAAVLKEGLSRNQAAKRFGIAISTAVNWMRQVIETGSVAPGKIGGYREKLIRGEHRDWLLARIKEKDFTIRGLVAELEAERGLKVDYKTMWSFLHDEGLSFKKKRRRQRARTSRHRAPA